MAWLGGKWRAYASAAAAHKTARDASSINIIIYVSISATRRHQNKTARARRQRCLARRTRRSGVGAAAATAAYLSGAQQTTFVLKASNAVAGVTAAARGGAAWRQRLFARSSRHLYMAATLSSIMVVAWRGSGAACARRQRHNNINGASGVATHRTSTFCLGDKRRRGTLNDSSQAHFQ